jgi:hypothetical protein
MVPSASFRRLSEEEEEEEEDFSSFNPFIYFRQFRHQKVSTQLCFASLNIN